MSNRHDLAAILNDGNFARDMRLIRLQGLRGHSAEQALRAGPATRLAPAACGVGAVAGAVFGSAALLGLLALTAVIGTVRPHHPIESAYNALARRQGAQQVPENLAGRRLGCLIGATFLGGATIAYTANTPTVGAILALSFGSLALLVAATNICIPSIIFTLIRGSERAKTPSLFRALFDTKAGSVCRSPET